jgi:hypothetical protein
MSSMMINGARYAVATAMSVPAAITAVSNAAPPVATTAVAPVEGAVLLVTSGWGDINEVPVVADNLSATTFGLLGYSTVDLVRNPIGEGIGAFQVASAFVNLPKIHDIQPAGGEQNYATRQYVDDPSGKQIQAPTFKTAQSRTFMLDYDPTKPHFAALVTLDQKRELVILRETLPNGDVIYYAGRLSFNKEPTRALNEFMSNALTFSMSADSVRYAAP